MKKSILHLSLLAALSVPVFAEETTVEAITEKFETEKAAALEAYLEKNPDAEDFGAGQEALLISYLMLGDMEKLPEAIEKSYETVDKSDPGRIIQQMVMPMVRAASETGDKERARKFLEKVKTEYISHPGAAQIMQVLSQASDMLNRPGPGEVMEIAFTSLAGKEVDMADMKGKVVLVDFWATWCGPCIKEMPNLKKAYDDFNEEGFEIVGISLDDDKATLEKFIETNDLPWPQAFDGKGWDGELPKKFAINGIPALFLIGKDGKIAAANLFGAELERAIKEELAKD